MAVVTRYQLPDALGGMVLPEDTGGQREVLTDGTTAVWLLRFDIPGVGRVRVQKEALVEVKPPLPPEPPRGAVIKVGEALFHHHLRESAVGWVNLRTDSWTTWEALHRRNDGVPVLLVPDPLADAPELPWVRNVSAGQLNVGVSGQDTRVVVGVTDQHDDRASVWIDPLTARRMGLALLRAAAEQGATAVPEPAARPRSCPNCHSAGLPQVRHEDQLCDDGWHHAVAGWATSGVVAQPVA